MTAQRIFIGALTLVFCSAAVLAGRFGPLEYVVASFPLLYLTLEMREELQELRDLERRVALLAGE